MLITMVSGNKQKQVLQEETNRKASDTEWKRQRPGNPRTEEGLLQGQALFSDAELGLCRVQEQQVSSIK